MNTKRFLILAAALLTFSSLSPIQKPISHTYGPGLYGFITRAISSYSSISVANWALESANPDYTNLKYTNETIAEFYAKHVVEHSPQLANILLQVNVMVTFCHILMQALKYEMGHQPGSPYDSHFDLAHMSGMDLFIAFDALKAAYQGFVALEYIEKPIQEYIPAALVSLLVGFGTGYTSVAIGEYVGETLFQHPLAIVTTIFTVFITLSWLAHEFFFAAGEKVLKDIVGIETNAITDCSMCQTTYQLGDDLAYILGWILPGIFAVWKSKYLVKTKEA